MNIHLIAIGGAVMHNLAMALHNKGMRVTGSDDEIFEPSRSRLAKYALLPEKPGWNPDRIHTGLDGVILGMHAKKDNPELLKAQELGLKIWSFPEYLHGQKYTPGGTQYQGWSAAAAIIAHNSLFENKQVFTIT